MLTSITFPLLVSLCMLSLVGWDEKATLPESAGFGPQPTLPAPDPPLFPTIHVARAKGWPVSAMPTAAAGVSVGVYAIGLEHPRWRFVLPNGDILVAETNAPPT